jgi:hypothetical protein
LFETTKEYKITYADVKLAEYQISSLLFSAVSKLNEFFQFIINLSDNSVLVLITLSLMNVKNIS